MKKTLFYKFFNTEYISPWMFSTSDISVLALETKNYCLKLVLHGHITETLLAAKKSNRSIIKG